MRSPAAVVAEESAEAGILLGTAPNGAARLDPRVAVQSGGTTLTEHMPKAHQKYLGRTPSRLIEDAFAA